MHTYMRPPVDSHPSDTACQWTPICNCTCWHTSVHVYPFNNHTQMNNAVNVLKTHVWYPQPRWLVWSSWHHVYQRYHTTVRATPSNPVTWWWDPAAGNLWVTCIQISQCQCLAQMSMSVVNCAEITNNKKTSQFPVTEVQRQLLLPTFDSLREIFWDYEQSVSNSSGTILPDSVHV